jgi:hypothetical protein
MEKAAVRAQIAQLLREMTNHAPKAGLMGGEWDRIMEVLDFCAMLEVLSRDPAHEAEALMRFLEEMRPHHRFIMDTVNKKRRPHPERSKRTFM